MSRPVTIALVWHQMNSVNLGVGALTLANLALCREAARDAGRDVRFLVLGWRDPNRDWYETPDDVENVPVRIRGLASPTGPVAEALKRADIVIDISAGDSFTDIYGFRRFAMMWGTKARAVWAGKPLILAPQTIGPFNAAWARLPARRVMNRATAVVTRDALSTGVVEKMGVTAETLEVTDVAMRLPYDRPAPCDGGPVKVGLNVSGLLMNGGYTGGNQFGLTVDYPALIRRVVGWFAEQEGVEMHLVGHVQAPDMPVEDDQRASEALAAEFPGTIVAPIFGSPVDAKSYIAGLDFFLGARMHATIAAFSSGVPVVPMAYSRKFTGLFETLGYPHVADMKAEDDDAILARIQAGFAGRDALKADLDLAMTRVDARLNAYRDIVARTIRGV